MSESLTPVELLKLVRSIYGGRLSLQTLNSETGKVGAVLYGSFPFLCGIDPGRGTFSAGIILADGSFIAEFFGKLVSLNGDVPSITASLRQIDAYCRLRLPDKYLEAYDAAYGTGPLEDEEG